MDIAWSATDLAFRDEVRVFLQEKLTPDLRQAGRLMTSVYADHEASIQWQRILHERGRSELDVRPRPHVKDAEEAAGHHVRADRHDHAGHSDPSAGDDVGRRNPEPGLLRRGAGAKGQRAR